LSSTIPADFVELEALYDDKGTGLYWPYVFSLPGWMSAWWRQFGVGYEPFIKILQDGGQILGVAPLKRRGETASFIGDASVCDYLDFVVVSGREEAFSQALFTECALRGITRLELETLRPDSVTVRHVWPVAQGRGFNIIIRDTDTSYEAALPVSFEAYLAGLSTQQHREILRKQRRLGMLGEDTFRMLAGEEIGDRDIEMFLSLMADSRRDKADFLTEEVRSYFKDMTRAMSSYGLLRLGFLDVGVKTVAGVLGFDYNNTFYLYNSGYDSSYTEFGVGLLSKLAAIRWAVAQQKAAFDFLKGPEAYKERLGGRRMDLKAGCLILG